MDRAPFSLGDAYKIDSELGFGGGGTVYKAWHSRLQKYVIVKELKEGSASNIEAQRNEVEALKNVKSPYLPQVFDFIIQDGRIFTVMEFIEGESLDKAIERNQKFTQSQIIKWYTQLASALEVIHMHDIVHRDIKPANIMLLPNDDVCLIDFNAALVSGNYVRLISRSLGYASPEQYEIYERHKHAYNSPINLSTSNVQSINSLGEPTEILTDNEKTEIIVDNDNDFFDGYDKDKTELVDDTQKTELITDTQKTELLDESVTEEIDWKLSDIYSLGATIYHLLTGIHPSERASDVIPLSRVGSYSEGIVYVVEKSMQLNPADRFASVELLADAVHNIHKFDTRWKIAQTKKIAAAIILPFSFAVFAGMALFGRNVMAQEKEERYYNMLYEIENGSEPQVAYDKALEMYWNRIEPYRAMAERLWNDGDMESCREYIESNLRNIAEFQNDENSQNDFGEIYYILGNCYYFRFEASDYLTAMNNFATAVQYVKDNQIYYRDYAIALARTGNINEAEHTLKKAQVLNLDDDSLNLLNGEIFYAKKEYDSALDSFAKVIEHASDDYNCYRAYHSSDEIYKLQGKPEKSVELLSNCLNKIPANRVAEMTERLADAYIKCNDYQSAISLLEQLAQSQVPQFHIMENLVILLQNENQFDRASEVLQKMEDLFPNDYRVPMRQAYLEADMQSQIKNEERDYALTKQYYETAVNLYEKNVKPGESDPEMQQLEQIIEQLKINKWI